MRKRKRTPHSRLRENALEENTAPAALAFEENTPLALAFLPRSLPPCA